MKRRLTYSLSALLIIAVSFGCDSDKKNDAATGPRITGGAPVDSKVGPQKPSVGGEVKPGQ